MKCSHCQFENPGETRFCGNCGVPLPRGPKPSSAGLSPTVTASVSLGELVLGGTFAGRYRICDELGRGGMGYVYKAVDREVNETVALKILRPEISADEKLIDRFRNELKLARRISHKNVCRIYDLGVVDGIYYISMEFIPGDNLKRIVRMMGPLSPIRALRVAGQVCDGMAEAHRLGVIHRDLKTSNIMIDADGDARIMDFGIALAATTKGLTDRGTLIGTPEYMAPEQIDGEEVDQRADIYSLGIILFELLSGRVPFEGPSPLSVAMKQKTARTPDLLGLNPEIPKALGAAIGKCLEKDAEARFQKIEALAAALHGVAEALAGPGAGLAVPGPDRGTPRGTQLTNSIAVLPFVDLSPNKDQEYFCEGLAEEIINALTKITSLEVAAKTSAFSTRFRNLDVREVGQQLGVGTVLEGSVRRDESRIRITAQLLNTATGYHYWSEKFERPPSDIFAIQDEITLAIVERLKVRLLGDEKAAILKRHTENAEAYNLYLMGRFFWNKRTAEGMKRGLESYAQAIQKDPSYALAYAGVADSYGIIASYYYPPRATMMKAREAAEMALKLDDTLAEAHNSYAFVKEKLEWDWEGAEREYRRAIELNPESVWSHHWYSLFLGAMGRHQESFAEINRALEIDPTSPQLKWAQGTLLYLARYYDRAAEEYGKVLEMDPDHVLANFYSGLVLLENARFDEALGLIQRAAAVAGSVPFFLQGIGYVHASAGRGQEANEMLARLTDISSKAYVSPFFTALIHMKLGEIDKGFDWLEKAFKDGDHWLEYIRVFPGFDAVRADPRYTALLSRLAL